MGKRTLRPESADREKTATVMLRLPSSLHIRLQEYARQKTLPPAVLARMLVLDGLNRLDHERGD